MLLFHQVASRVGPDKDNYVVWDYHVVAVSLEHGIDGRSYWIEIPCLASPYPWTVRAQLSAKLALYAHAFFRRVVSQPTFKRHSGRTCFPMVTSIRHCRDPSPEPLSAWHGVPRLLTISHHAACFASCRRLISCRTLRATGRIW